MKKSLNKHKSLAVVELIITITIVLTTDRINSYL